MYSDEQKLTQNLEDLYPETEVALMRLGKDQAQGFRNQPSSVIELSSTQLHTPREFYQGRSPSKGSIADIQAITESPDGGVYRIGLRRNMMREGEIYNELLSDIYDLGKRLPEGAVVQFQPPMDGGVYFEHDVAMDAGLGPVQRDTYEQYGVVRNRQLVPVSPFGTLPHYEATMARQAMNAGDIEAAVALQSDLRRKIDQGVITLDDLSDIPTSRDRMVEDFFADLPDSDPDKQEYLQEEKLRAAMAYDEKEAMQTLVQALTPESQNMGMGRSTVPFANDPEVRELSEKLSPYQRGESPFNGMLDENGRPKARAGAGGQQMRPQTQNTFAGNPDEMNDAQLGRYLNGLDDKQIEAFIENASDSAFDRGMAFDERMNPFYDGTPGLQPRQAPAQGSRPRKRLGNFRIPGI